MNGGSNKTLEYFQPLGRDRMHKLFQIFQIDFEMFDYSIDSYERLFLWLFLNLVKTKRSGIDFTTPPSSSEYISRLHKTEWILFPADLILFHTCKKLYISLFAFNWHFLCAFTGQSLLPSPLYGAKRFERRKLRRA